VANTGTSRREEWAGVRAVLILGVLPVAIGVLTTQLPDWWPVWAAAAVLAVVIAAYRVRNAPMSRLASSPIGYLIAGALLAGFLITLPLAAQHEHNPLLVLLPAGLLWASTLTAFKPVVRLLSGFAIASMAVGEAGLLYGLAVLRAGEGISGAAMLLIGAAMLLYGAAMLLLGETELRSGNGLLGMAMLVGGVAGLLFGAAGLRQGDSLLGSIMLLGGVAMLLYGAAILRHNNGLVGVAMLFIGVAWLLGGIDGLHNGDSLFGAAMLLFAVALLLFGAATLRHDNDLGKAGRVAGLLIGVGWFLGGITVLRDGNSALGAAMLLVGLALLLGVGSILWNFAGLPSGDDSTATPVGRAQLTWQRMLRWATTPRTPPASARAGTSPHDQDA
jgi:hypothetical protein